MRRGARSTEMAGKSGETRYQRYARSVRERFGISVYQYKNQRSVERTGKTLYQRRKESEQAKRNLPPVAPTPVSVEFVSDVMRKNAWLQQHGFTERATGVDPSVLYAIQPYLEQMWGTNSKVTPEMLNSLIWLGYNDTEVAALVDLKQQAWTLYRNHDQPGAHVIWEQMMEIQHEEAPFDKEWWYYH